MTCFVLAYALAFLLWKARGDDDPWLLLAAILAVSVWVVLYVRYLRRTR